MTGRLHQKVAIVTGKNGGIGETTAHTFAKEGAKVALMARRVEQGETVAKAITDTGGGAGNNFPNEPNEEWLRVIDINLNGTFYVSKAVWPHLVDSWGRGTVVNMSSLAAQRGFSPAMRAEFGATSASYWAAKAGVDALTRYMAGIGGEHNIRVNRVRPGQILTPGATRGTSKDPDGGHHVFENMFNFAQIVKGPGVPQDVANVVLFLVYDEATFRDCRDNQYRRWCGGKNLG